MTLELADQERRAGNYKKALSLYRKALEEQPESAAAHEGVAACLVTRKDYIGALASAQRALDLDPSLVNPHLFMADCYRLLGKMDDAEREMNKAIALESDLGAVLYLEGVILLMKNQDNDAAVRFRRSLDADPGPVKARAAHLNLGYIFHKQGDFKHAVQEYEAAYRIKPSRNLLVKIWPLKYRVAITVILTLLTVAVVALSYLLNNGLLLALYFFILFLSAFFITVRYVRQRNILWGSVAGFITLVFGWLVYLIASRYFQGY